MYIENCKALSKLKVLHLWLWLVVTSHKMDKEDRDLTRMCTWLWKHEEIDGIASFLRWASDFCLCFITRCSVRDLMRAYCLQPVCVQNSKSLCGLLAWTLGWSSARMSKQWESQAGGLIWQSCSLFLSPAGNHSSCLSPPCQIFMCTSTSWTTSPVVTP